MNYYYSTHTLEQVRKAVDAASREKRNIQSSNEPLHLDSITRITLLVELENQFQIELSVDNITPESFESLASLAAFIEKLQQ